jgi:hypothetical protein
MRAEFPIKVVYNINKPAPLNEVIDSLLAMRTLISDGISNLEIIIPSLEVQSYNVRISEITQSSPLKELGNYPLDASQVIFTAFFR